jgi:hypothetical protein
MAAVGDGAPGNAILDGGFAANVLRGAGRTTYMTACAESFYPFPYTDAADPAPPGSDAHGLFFHRNTVCVEHFSGTAGSLIVIPATPLVLRAPAPPLTATGLLALRRTPSSASSKIRRTHLRPVRG